MDKKILIQGAKAIVTCDGSDNVFFDADILIDGKRIEKIGQGIPTEGVDEVIDARGKFVYPGLVNTHHHFFQTFVRNLKTIDYPNMTVPEWLDKIYRIFQRVDYEEQGFNAALAVLRLEHRYTRARLERACAMALASGLPSPRNRHLKPILEKRLRNGLSI